MKSKILVVDDEPDALDVLGFKLKEAGYIPLFAKDGTRALAAALLVLPWGAAAPLDLADLVSPPLVREWVRPDYPPEALAKKQDGSVQLQVVVDATGAVTSARAVKSSAPEFEAPAVAAVKLWRFSPATDGGRPVAKCMTFTFPFHAADMKRPAGLLPPRAAIESLAYAPQVAAKERLRTEPDYPDALAERGLPGKVKIEFTIGADGQPQALKILGVTHSDFVPPALAAIGQWRYEPARMGDLIVDSTMQTVLEFGVLGLKRSDVFKAAGLTALPAPEGAESASDPEPLVSVDPIFPRELATAGKTGTAAVDLTVGPEGTVTAVELATASEPAFGQALAAALAAWQFSPARQRSGPPVSARVRCTHEFKLEGTPEERLVNLLRAGDATKFSAKGLDRPLRPILRVGPEFPTLREPATAKREVTVEFIIDREGRARLPRVVAGGDDEALAWAAATAISRWVFEPPRRSGQSADVIVAIPLVF